MKLDLKKGTTSKLIQIWIPDSASTTGGGKTGIVFNSAGLTAYYYREGAASPVAISLQTMTVGTWVTGGFKEIDSVNMPGLYQLGLPDLALATGANSVDVLLKGATGMAPVVLEMQLVDYDPFDAVALGLSRLDAAVSSRAAIADYTTARAVKLDTLDAAISTRAAAVDYTTARAAKLDNLDVVLSTRLATAGYTAPDNADILLIKAKTDNLPSDPADESLLEAAIAAAEAAILAKLPAALVGGRMDASVGAMAADILTAAATAADFIAEIKAQVVAALAADLYAEPGATPAALATLAAKIGWIFAMARNDQVEAAGSVALKNDAGSGTLATSTLTDNGATFTRGKWT